MPEPVSVECVIVTPAQAAFWIERHLFERQRTVRQTHVTELAEAMRSGRFIGGSQISFAVLGEKMWLIDGQHRLWAIVEADVSVSLAIRRIHVSDELEIGAHYARLDRHLTRSYADAVRATSIDERIGITRQQAIALCAAVRSLQSGFTDGGRRYEAAPEMRTFDSRGDLMVEYADEARCYFSLMSGVAAYRRKLFMRAAIIGVALLTLRLQREHATRFWGGAMQDEGLVTGDSRKALLRWLEGHRSTSDQREARGAAAAWNAYFEGRALQQIRVDIDSPLRIAGTNFMGEFHAARRKTKEPALHAQFTAAA